ncbi:cupin domain-containing protein [Methylobacterium currus]|nr:cupin domain-containing protein [Methylobacterium currus]UHC17606.1 cupin domain-containing protein [Methylobacterium currus]
MFEKVRAHGGKNSILTCRAVGATGSVNFIDLTVVPSGGDIGVHTHADDNEEIYVVVSGTATMLVDGRRIAVTAGDVIVNRPGGTHGLWNTGAEEVRLVVVEVPLGASGRAGP